MTTEDIINMAREAGIADAFMTVPHPGVITQLERFAKLVGDEVVAAEREACANAAGPEDSYRDEWFNAKADSVKRIRARSNSIDAAIAQQKETK